MLDFEHNDLVKKIFMKTLPRDPVSHVIKINVSGIVIPMYRLDHLLMQGRASAILIGIIIRSFSCLFLAISVPVPIVIVVAIAIASITITITEP